jgi:hypothetical protein
MRGNDSTTCMDIIMKTLARSVDIVNEGENSIMKSSQKHKKEKKKTGMNGSTRSTVGRMEG